MSISDAQKVDLLYKKLAGGVSKTDVSSSKSASSEIISSPLFVLGSHVWTQGDQIPETPPISTSGVVRVRVGVNAIACIPDATAATNRTWLTQVADWIPSSISSLYQVKVHAGNPMSGGTRLFPDGSGNDDQWHFDYQAGVLNFIGQNIPSSVPGKIVYIEGYSYIGTKGEFSPVSSVSGRTGDVVLNTSDIEENGDNRYYTPIRESLKADKVSGATSGNIASLDNSGNLQDSGASVNSLKGPKFTFEQTSPSSTWVINHNLGYRPQVQVLTSSGSIVEGGERHVNVNTIELTFHAIFSGTAYLF